MLSPVLVTPPAGRPVSLADAKIHLHVDHDDQDELIEALVQAATDHLDGVSGVLGRALVTQTWRISDSYGCSPLLRLPLAPVQSIASVKYSDVNNAEQTWASSNYTLHADALGPYLKLASAAAWPSLYDRDDALRIEFVAGYGAESAVPDALKSAIKLHVERLFDVLDADAAEQNLRAYNALISPYCRWPA